MRLRLRLLLRHPPRKLARAPGCAPNARLFTTPEAEAIKKEICGVGRKLWLRQFVDGNGGNISYRIGPNEVLCTPTLVSKYDLTPEDICMVDLEGNQIAGTKPRTSELSAASGDLQSRAARPKPSFIAIRRTPRPMPSPGACRPTCVIPEFEILVGKVAIAPYETPGTAAFAESVLPYVKQHNTVLLANHGIVCWSDTVTHAEWSAEVLETYCWTLMLAAQLGAPISRISEEHASELLAMKKKLGLPDIRFDTPRMNERQLSDLEVPSSIALEPTPGDGSGNGAELESLVKTLTDAVMKPLPLSERRTLKNISNCCASDFRLRSLTCSQSLA